MQDDSIKRNFEMLLELGGNTGGFYEHELGLILTMIDTLFTRIGMSLVLDEIDPEIVRVAVEKLKEEAGDRGEE